MLHERRTLITETWRQYNRRIRRQNLSAEEQIRLYLTLGLEILDLEIGNVSRITDESYEVIYSTGSIEGLRVPLGHTLCSVTMEQDDLLTVPHLQMSSHMRHPLYTIFNVEAYIGAALWVGTHPFGTLNFIANRPHIVGFDDADRWYVRMAAQAIMNLLEHEIMHLA